MAFDIIGDVHGHADRLEALLQKMGYQQRSGAWRHSSRTAIFVGDLIDRGAHQVRTLQIVRDMIDAGSARATMGNHEFNAIAWATPHPDRPGDHLRTRSGSKGQKNRHQHQAFLTDVGEDTQGSGKSLSMVMFAEKVLRRLGGKPVAVLHTLSGAVLAKLGPVDISAISARIAELLDEKIEGVAILTPIVEGDPNRCLQMDQAVSVCGNKCGSE